LAQCWTGTIQPEGAAHHDKLTAAVLHQETSRGTKEKEMTIFGTAFVVVSKHYSVRMNPFVLRDYLSLILSRSTNSL
jgi:hypothetical protein